MRTKNPITVLGPDGRPLAGAQVYTRVRASGADATVYAAETGAAPGTNPGVTDANGRAVQWLERGAYASTITSTAPGFTPYVEEWDSAPASDQAIDTAWLSDRSATPAKIDTSLSLVDVYANRPAAAAALNGVSFYATDKGMTWRCAAGAWVLTHVRALEVTTLPVGPIDLQEILFVADAANGIVWHFRYRAASASAFKWELLSGPFLYALADAAETTAGDGVWRDLTTVGPTITTPTAFAGDYNVEWGAVSTPAATNGDRYMGFRVGATDPTVGTRNSLTWGGAGATTGNVPGSRADRTNNVAANTTIKAVYRAGSGISATFQQRWMRIRPVRIG